MSSFSLAKMMLPMATSQGSNVAEGLGNAVLSEFRSTTSSVMSAASAKASALERSFKAATGGIMSTAKQEPPTREYKVDFKHWLRADECGFIRFKGDGTLEIERCRTLEGVVLPQDRRATWTLRRDEAVSFQEPNPRRGGAVAIRFPRRDTDTKEDTKGIKELYLVFGGGEWNAGAAKGKQQGAALHQDLQDWFAANPSGDLMGKAMREL